jgi:hypothetical protein
MGAVWGRSLLLLRSILEQAQIPANKGLDALGHEEKEAHAWASLRRKQASVEWRSRPCAKDNPSASRRSKLPLICSATSARN